MLLKVIIELCKKHFLNKTIDHSKFNKTSFVYFLALRAKIFFQREFDFDKLTRSLERHFGPTFAVKISEASPSVRSCRNESRTGARRRRRRKDQAHCCCCCIGPSSQPHFLLQNILLFLSLSLSLTTFLYPTMYFPHFNTHSHTLN